jgi:cell division protein FtsI (penicillin-binding protein 3)
MKKPIPYLEDTQWKSRIRLLRFSCIVLFGLLLSRLFYWQILQGDQLQAVAESQYTSTLNSSGSRGSIYTADGYTLATNQDVYTLFAEPRYFSLQPKEIAELLAPNIPFDLKPEEATDEAVVKATLEGWRDTFIQRLTQSSSQWISLKRRLPEEHKVKIEQLQIAGIDFERDEMRYYPEASMAAHLLGFVGNDEAGDPKGYFGIEGYYDRELQGKAGRLTLERDARGLPIAIGSFDEVGAVDGRAIVLTVRRDLQFLLEQKLKEGMEKYGSKTAEAAIMDPKTGAILAMASYPNYDPISFSEFDPQLYKNLFVQDVYEPGSTLKILTVAAGIDSGAITPETICDQCGGPREIGGYTIRTWNNEYFENSTVTDGLVHSDNTVMMYIAQKVGMEKYLEYLHAFGFGEKTGIDLQEEALAPLRKDWREIDLATSSFGQGIVTTGIQMLSVAQTIANKGVMMKPMLVKEVKQDGQSIIIEPRSVKNVLSQKTAEQVTTMMEASAQHGDAKWAIPKGYRIAGKTGTAQIALAGHYDEEKTIASFIGFAPADDPQFVMLVKLREPQSSQWGSETAAPLWFSIAKDLFIRMKIPPRN